MCNCDMYNALMLLVSICGCVSRSSTWFDVRMQVILFHDANAFSQNMHDYHVY